MYLATRFFVPATSPKRAFAKSHMSSVHPKRVVSMASKNLEGVLHPLQPPSGQELATTSRDSQKHMQQFAELAPSPRLLESICIYIYIYI